MHYATGLRAFSYVSCKAYTGVIYQCKELRLRINVQEVCLLYDITYRHLFNMESIQVIGNKTSIPVSSILTF